MNLDYYETKCASVISPEDGSRLAVCIRPRHHDGPHAAVIPGQDGVPQLLLTPNHDPGPKPRPLASILVGVIVTLSLLIGAVLWLLLGLVAP